MSERADPCAPIDVLLVGYPRATVVPPELERDRHAVGGADCRRVVLTPAQPSVELRLGPGRWVRLRAWATRTDLSPACRHAQTLAADREAGR